MSIYTESQDWLNLKHRTTTKPCIFGLSGGRDSDWDFADTPSRGYSFVSESTPVQLHNNSGGMDEDDDIKDVWYPHQTAAHETEDVDSEMSSGDDDMDMNMSIETTTITTTTSNPDDSHPFHHQYQQPQTQTHQHQHHHRSDSSVNKRKRDSDAVELNAGLPNFGLQQPSMAFDNSKRVRIGA
jgi:hypothetical protein